MGNFDSSSSLQETAQGKCVHVSINYGVESIIPFPAPKSVDPHQLYGKR